MVSSRTELLTSLILELIEILRDRRGETWAAIVRITQGKSATIAIDDARILLTTSAQDDLQITISEAGAETVNDFESTAIALRNIMFGRSTLEKSVASGKIFIRASFADLLKIRSIVSAVLADTSVEPRLSQLWQKFDQEWQP
jgi:hypothetical protein